MIVDEAKMDGRASKKLTFFRVRNALMQSKRGNQLTKIIVTLQ